jgi:hypothetical protein
LRRREALAADRPISHWSGRALADEAVKRGIVDPALRDRATVARDGGQCCAG